MIRDDLSDDCLNLLRVILNVNPDLRMTAGDIYYQDLINPSYNLFDDLNQINRWIHPFPMNKFFLWFPGVKEFNNCLYVDIPRELVFYQPVIYYKLVGPKKSYSLSLQQWKEYNPNLYLENKQSEGSQTVIDSKIIITLVVTVIILMLAFAIFTYVMMNKK